MSGYIGTQPVPQATQTRQTFTATSGQTSFATVGYVAGGQFIQVYLNGVLLKLTDDYTAENGSDILLTSGAATGDILEFISFADFTVNNQTFTGTTTVTDLTATGDINGVDAILSGGAYLGGTGSANKLDDVETGTWTAGIEINNNATGITYSSRSASYVKIGKLVFVDGDIQLSSKGSTSGTVKITGLPFTVYDRTNGTSLDGGASLCAFQGGTSGIYSPIGLVGSGGTTNISMYIATTSGANISSNLTNAKITGSFSIRFSLTYRIA